MASTSTQTRKRSGGSKAGKLVTQSGQTRKTNRSAAERRAKRRQKWTVHESMTAKVESLGGQSAIVTGPQGGLFVEYELDGAFHAVPIEAVQALGLLA